MRRLLIMLCVVVAFSAVYAQEASDLLPEEVEMTQGVDVYGQPALLAEGVLTNQNANEAYTNISLFADVYDAAGTVIGEGFGYIVDECGVALTDFALQPNTNHDFVIVLELYEDGTTPDRVEIFAEGNSTEAQADETELPDSIEQVSRDEVVALEWVDAISLRYGVGCANRVFTELDWYDFNLNTGSSVEITHPNVERVTDAMLTQTDLINPLYYQHSFLTFSPTSRRIVYQTDLSAFISAEPDGSYKRILYDDELFRHSLQGILWQPEGVFLAYYFGAYGETVLYFTGTADGQLLSNSIYENPPSLTVPGLSPDGRQVIIAVTLENGTGYYLQDAFYENSELLFEGDAPGNNYPAPIYVERESGDYIYLVRVVEEQPTLQCFERGTSTLHDLVTLPLHLTSQSRAWTWLSPDGYTLALSANGLDGGLWLVDLTAFDVCQ